MKTTISVTIDAESLNFAKLNHIKRSDALEFGIKNINKRSLLPEQIQIMIDKAVNSKKESDEENIFLWQRVEKLLSEIQELKKKVN